ncbi:dTMP kinase [bacterium]
MTALKKGLLVAIEGTDGTGKSTQALRLKQHFSDQGLETKYLREPTDGKYGREIRRLAQEGRHQVTPEEEMELFIMDRIEDCEKNIHPALANHELIIIDRYYFSTIAYQGALGLDTDEIWKRNETIAIIPDMVLILDMPIEKALQRITQQRGDTHDDFEKADFLHKAQAIFQSMNRSYIHHLSADRDPDEVFEEMRDLITELIVEYKV